MRLVSLVCLVSFAACATAEDADGEPGEVSLEQISWNSLMWADLAPNLALAHQVIAARLQPSQQIALLVDTTPGYNVLTYLVRCGVPAGRRVWLPNSAGVWKPFDGRIGFAPNWTVNAPTLLEQTLIMGCIAAHENAIGERIEFDLRCQYAACQPFAPGNTKLDGAFWADATTHTYFSCRGDGHVLMCGEDDTDWLKRTCDEGDARCGAIVYCGRCSKICTPGPNGTFTDCTCDKKVYKNIEVAYLRPGDTYSCD